MAIQNPFSKKQERPENSEQINQPVSSEMPLAGFEVEKKVEIEAKPEETESAGEGKKDEGLKITPSVTTASTTPVLAVKSETLTKIENVLQEDLEDIYFQMPPEKQQEFKKAGEETATQIEILLKETKIKIKKVLGLIKNWLKIIPGINKFFLEQEAKIKADKILDISENMQESQQSPDLKVKDKNKI